MALPVSFNTVPVRAHYVDLEGNPAKGTINFTPAVTFIVDGAERTIIIGKTLVKPLVNGFLDTQLPATDDPDVDPTNFTYLVEEIFVGLAGRKYSLSVPLVALDIGGVDLALAVHASPSAGSPLPFMLDQLADVEVAGAAAGTTIVRGTDGYYRPAPVTVVGSDAWLITWAANPDAIVFGTLTRTPQEALATAPVVWPDGKVGVFTALTYSPQGAVNSYRVTYINGSVTKTVTQPAMTRDAAGAVIVRPVMVVS